MRSKYFLHILCISISRATKNRGDTDLENKKIYDNEMPFVLTVLIYILNWLLLFEAPGAVSGFDWKKS